MSSGDHGAIRIERCISRRVGGTYAVSIWDGNVNARKSFKTLREARSFRESVVKSRKANAAQPTISLREQIESSPTSTVIRDGRKFTLRKLPEVLT